jgi:predicted PolB exonuclease-like 3'-5' exonuclease
LPPRNVSQIAARADFVFDIETIPDADLCRRVYGEPGMSDDEAVAAAAKALNREETGILPEAYQKPIVIAAVTLDYAHGAVKPLILIEGRPRTPGEEALLEHFWRALEPDPRADTLRRIVSFNGKAFDMRVLEVRSLQFPAISCATYFKPGEKFDTYRHKYSEEEHLDLIDYIPNYGSKAGYSLRTIASLVGLPGKDKMDGSQVYPVYRSGGIMQIAAYCFEDVIQTALIKLRLDRLRGVLTREQLDERITWFLEQTEKYLVAQAVPREAAFTHTLEELRTRYRPALLGNASDVSGQTSDA